MIYLDFKRRLPKSTHLFEGKGQPGAVLRALLALLTLMLTAAAPQATASIATSEELTRIGGISESGSGPGQLDHAAGLASDPVTGHLYAVEEGNSRISEFTPWGTFVKAIGFDVAPGAVNEQQEVRVRAAAGQFKLTFAGSTTPDLAFNAGAVEVEAALDALASMPPGASVSVKTVPGAPGGAVPTVHVVSFKGSLGATDVAQIEATNGPSPLAGGTPSTDLLVRTRINGRSGATGPESCTEESGCKTGVPGGAPGQISRGQGVTVDKAGNVYVKERGNLRVQKFDSAGRFVLMFGGKVNKTTGQNLCVQTSSDVCGGGVEGNGPGEFTGSPGSEGVAFCPPGPLCGLSGAIYVADVGRIQRFSLEGEYEGELSLPGKAVEGLAFDPAGEDLYATYEGDGSVHELEPNTGMEISQPRKGSRLIATGTNGELFATSEGKVVLEYDPTGTPLNPSSCCVPELLPPPNPFDQHFVFFGMGTNGAGDLQAAYVSNTDSFIRVFGPGPVGFEGPPPVPPTIVAQFASSVQRDSATVAALINPHFFTDTRYRVQYGTGECASGGCPNEAPAAPSLLSAKAFGSPLRTAGVILEHLAPGTTYHYRFVAESSGGGPSVGAEAEMTTPDPLPQPACGNDVFRGGSSVRLPDCRAYEMVSPVDKNNGDIKTLVDLIGYDTNLGQSSEDGNRFTYSASRSFGSPKGAPLTNQYLARRIWSSEAISPAQGPGADINATPDAIGNPYKLFSADLCTGWFVVAAEPLLDVPRDFTNYRNVYRRDFCGGAPDEALLGVKPTVGIEEFNPEPQGASADGREAVVRVKDKLTPDAVSGGWQTYYTHDGQVDFLCRLPNGNSSVNCSAGSGSGISPPYGLSITELNRKTSVSHAISEDGRRVYWTDSGPTNATGPGAIYLRVNPGDEQSAVGCEEGGACTVDVSKTKTSQSSRFLGAAPDGSKALFEVVEGGFKENLFLFDAEADESTLIAGNVIGLVAASDDLSRVYYVSREALGPDAVSGAPNLYLSEEGGEKTFIATLSTDDVASIDIPSNTSTFPIYHAARASADGGELAFISNRSLTGYDNIDLASGVADSEVYLYEAGASGPVCVSCSPSGARPQGRVTKANGNVSSLLPASGLLPMPKYTLQASRALSDDGERLFFESFDSLVPRDVNVAKDVYEWESAPSKAVCAQMGAEIYAAATGGCLSLISSGESPEDSEFIDASASGNDVFFVTNGSLLPQDPGLFDVYDARVGGGLPTPTSPAACQGETCKPPATAPSDSTPASSNYAGPGNVKEKARKKAKKKQHKNGKKHKKKQSKKKASKKKGAER
jgi:hypothetical protein